MSRTRITLILFLLAGVTLALLFRRPLQSWAATQSCLRQARDHYSNVEGLKGAPDFDSYLTSAELQCRAGLAFERFENAETEEARRQAGAEAIAAYGELSETEQGWIFLTRRGAIRAELGQVEEALADYNLFLVHAPDNSRAREERAGLYTELGRYEEALADLEAAYRQAQQEDANAATLARIEQRMEEVAAQQ